MSTKETLIEMIRKMPDNVTVDDAIYELYVRTQIEEGIRELDNGEGIPREEVKRRMARWFS